MFPGKSRPALGLGEVVPREAHVVQPISVLRLVPKPIQRLVHVGLGQAHAAVCRPPGNCHADRRVGTENPGPKKTTKNS